MYIGITNTQHVVIHVTSESDEKMEVMLLSCRHSLVAERLEHAAANGEELSQSMKLPLTFHQTRGEKNAIQRVLVSTLAFPICKEI